MREFKQSAAKRDAGPNRQPPNQIQVARLPHRATRRQGVATAKDSLMDASRIIVAMSFCLVATLAQAAGIQSVDVPAAAGGPALHGAIWYPCSDSPQQISIDEITLSAVKNCTVNGNKLPLVVVSHGRGGSFAGHHDTAETLADAGFAVAAINHPGDTVTDMSHSDDLSALVE